MNRFMRLTTRGVLSLAAVVGSGVGYNVFERQCNADGTCGKANCCADGACGACDAARKKIDWQQLQGDHCWPSQFSRESMRRVNEPFGQQMVNGNNVELTIWPHYFEADKGHESVLNEAGMSRLRYLARKRPFVIPNLQLQSSYDATLDQQRIEAAINYLRTVTFEPVPWNVTVVNRPVTGLYGLEGPKVINKMIGPGAGPPVYETQIKQGFSGGGAGAGS